MITWSLQAVKHTDFCIAKKLETLCSKVQNNMLYHMLVFACKTASAPCAAGSTISSKLGLKIKDCFAYWVHCIIVKLLSHHMVLMYILKHVSNLYCKSSLINYKYINIYIYRLLKYMHIYYTFNFQSTNTEDIFPMSLPWPCPCRHRPQSHLSPVGLAMCNALFKAYRTTISLNVTHASFTSFFSSTAICSTTAVSCAAVWNCHSVDLVKWRYLQQTLTSTPNTKLWTKPNPNPKLSSWLVTLTVSATSFGTSPTSFSWRVVIQSNHDAKFC